MAGLKTMGEEGLPEALRALLGAEPQDLDLYRQALTHASYALEEGLPVETHSYERLEFLGDAVLQLAVSHWVYERRPQVREGELTRLRASVVREETLAALGRDLALDRLARLGKTEAQGDEPRPKLLTDLLEALLGALYLDQGWERARDFVFSLLDQKPPTLKPVDNPRGELQEKLQRMGKTDIQYVVVEEEGPPHRPLFTVELRVEGETLAVGRGPSKQAAAREAAMKALSHLAEEWRAPETS
ncbi:MAG: ribonuclease III [Bacillota bacterium]|nr:ribonuclease III [Bacillota bacterium]